ncbi:MAG: hypothetical protein IJF95_07975 [Erysipelotrichaceae bacterium]|nr:hypothetical protein [Erysipelotrichaceae bacterium]
MEKNELPISREYFIGLIERYRKTLDTMNFMHELMEQNSNLFLETEVFHPTIMDEIVELLDIIFDLPKDDEGNTVIDYWVREQDFGRKGNIDYIYYLGENRRLPEGYDAGEIYDLICELKQ